MRELLIALQKQAAEMEFKASVLVQEIGLALERLDAGHQQGGQVCCACQNADGIEQDGEGDWYCIPCWKTVLPLVTR